MSAKSTIKSLVPEAAQGSLYRWVALLTGSKNTLKGAGFFMGGLLLAWLGFSGAILAMFLLLLVVGCCSGLALRQSLGKNTQKARSHSSVDSFLPLWIMGYGAIQALAPTFVAFTRVTAQASIGKQAAHWVGILALIPAGIGLGLIYVDDAETLLVVGLLLFGVVFAINSSLHSFLIVHMARRDGASLDIGFYYMANAIVRLLGTVLSGWLFQSYGLVVCFMASTLFLVVATVLSLRIPGKAEER